METVLKKTKPEEIAQFFICFSDIAYFCNKEAQTLKKEKTKEVAFKAMSNLKVGLSSSKNILLFGSLKAL